MTDRRSGKGTRTRGGHDRRWMILEIRLLVAARVFAQSPVVPGPSVDVGSPLSDQSLLVLGARIHTGTPVCT